MAGGASLTDDAPSELTLRLLADKAAATTAGAGDADEGDGASPSAAAAASSSSSSSSAAPSADPERAGLLQAIGYKEFEEHLALLDSGAAPAEAAAALARAAQRLREATHQYARKQERWLRNRFAQRGVRMLELESGGADASPEAWDAAVLRPALEDVRAWLGAADGGADDGDAVPHAPEAARVRAWRQFTCAPCGGRLINGELAWAEHEASARHKRNARFFAEKRAESAAEPEA